MYNELIKNARIIADSIHVHSSFQDWEAAEKDTLEKCADALEAAEKRIADFQEPTEKQVVDYCHKRCLVIVEGELFQRMKATYGRIQKRGECEAKKPKTVKETEYSFYCDCPTCGERLINNVDGEWCAGSFDRFCRMCGQKIDWSEYCGWSNMPRGERTKGASDEH